MVSSEARKIMRLTPSQASALQEKARLGDKAAARRFVLWGAWNRIRSNQHVPMDVRPRLLNSLIKIISQVPVEHVGA